jgi:hypothetical protein
MRLSLILCLGFAAGCGKQIGDACLVSSDCSIDGTRVCDRLGTAEGYCTIIGCDYATCPEEAVCVRFFAGGFSNRPCGVQADCSLDELCTLEGQCVPRSAEVRYCMKKCDQQSDCRDGYECRDFQGMIDHGGEPSLAPGVPVDETTAPAFCAVAPAS